MKAKIEARLKDGRVISIETEDSDVAQEIPEWDSFSAAKKYKALVGRADLFVLDYLRSVDEISDEFFAQRAREVKERMQ